jgi:hypothetical protein
MIEACYKDEVADEMMDEEEDFCTCVDRDCEDCDCDCDFECDEDDEEYDDEEDEPETSEIDQDILETSSEDILVDCIDETDGTEVGEIVDDGIMPEDSSNDQLIKQALELSKLPNTRVECVKLLINAWNESKKNKDILEMMKVHTSMNESKLNCLIKNLKMVGLIDKKPKRSKGE